MRKQVYFLIALFLCILSLSYGTITVKPQNDCYLPYIADFTESHYCTLLFTTTLAGPIDIANAAGTASNSLALMKLTTDPVQPCTLSNGVLTATGVTSSNGIACRLEFDGTTKFITYNQDVQFSSTTYTTTASIPLKEWSPSFLELRDDCGSSLTTCTLIIEIPTTHDVGQVSLQHTDTNFKIVSYPDENAVVDFTLLPSVSQYTLPLSTSANDCRYAIQFEKHDPGCRQYLFYISATDNSNNSIIKIPVNTNYLACSVAIQPQFGSNCENNKHPLCTITFPIIDELGSTFTIANFFDDSIQRTFLPIPPTTDSSNPINATCATIAPNLKDLIITYGPTDCIFVVTKPDQDTTAATLLSFKISEIENPDETIQQKYIGSPIAVKRVYTQPFLSATPGSDCSNPVSPLCTYTFSAFFVPQLSITIDDSDFIGRATTNSITVVCQPDIQYIIDSPRITFRGTTTTSTEVTCSITMSFAVRYQPIPTAGRHLFFLVSELSDVTSVPNSIAPVIPSYPPLFQFDPIISIVKSPSCDDPDIHICTLSFTHPTTLSPSHPLTISLHQKANANDLAALPLLPIPDPAITVVPSTSTAVWKLSTASVPFSTITFPKGPIRADVTTPTPIIFSDFVVRYTAIGDEQYSSTVYVLPTEPSSIVKIVQSDFIRPLADCLDKQTSLCTFAYQSFSSKFELVISTPGVIEASFPTDVIKTTSPGADPLDPITYTFTNLTSTGQTYFFTFSAPIRTTKITITPKVYLHDFATTSFAYVAPSEYPFQYLEDGEFYLQGDCSDLTISTCTILTHFSNLNVDEGLNLLTFTLSGGFEFIETVFTDVACLEHISVSATIESTTKVLTIEVTHNSAITSDQVTCPIVVKKPYALSVPPAYVTSLFNQEVDPEIERPITVSYNPIIFTPQESCYTYPAPLPDGTTKFQCDLIFGFMGGEIVTFQSESVATYNWFGTDSPDVNCKGALDHLIATVKYESGTKSTQLTFPNEQPITMITFCKASYFFSASTSNPYNYQSFDSIWHLNKLLPTNTTFPLTFPAPPTQSPFTFTYTSFNAQDPAATATITVELHTADIQTIILLEDDYVFTDFVTTPVTCDNGLLELAVINGKLNMNVLTPYTITEASATCTFPFKPTARTPIGYVKHQVNYNGGLPTQYTYVRYPELKRIVEWSPPSTGCINVDTCIYTITFNPGTVVGNFKSAIIPNQFQWINGVSSVACTTSDNNIIAYLEYKSDNELDLKTTNDGADEISTQITCTLPIPIAREIQSSWALANFTTSLLDDPYQYLIEFTHMVPISYVTLDQTYCRAEEPCHFRFRFDPIYLMSRPMISFESPALGYWTLQDGNLCELSQVGTTIYLRVINDLRSFESFNIEPTCTLIINTMMPDIPDTSDPTANPYKIKSLQINRYQLPPEAFELMNQGDFTPLYESQPFAPPEINRYQQLLPTLLQSIYIYPKQVTPVNVIKPPGADCIAAPDGTCTLIFAVQIPDISTIRITNFMSFLSIVDTQECIGNPIPYTSFFWPSITFVPGSDLKYIYATYPYDDRFPFGYSCTMVRKLTESRGPKVQQHAYAFAGISPNTGNVETTKYYAQHDMTYESYSPYGFYLDLDHTNNPTAWTSHMARGADFSWIRLTAARPTDESLTTPISYKTLSITFALRQSYTNTIYNDNPTRDLTHFSQLTCIILPRHQTGVRPTCKAYPSITGRTNEVFITFSDNASSETINGFYLTFTTYYPLQSLPLIHHEITTLDYNTGVVLQEKLPFVSQKLQLVGAPGQPLEMTEPILTVPTDYVVLAWPGEIKRDLKVRAGDKFNRSIPVELPYEDSHILFFSERDDNKYGIQTIGTSVHIRVQSYHGNPGTQTLVTGSYIDIMLYTYNSGGLPIPLRIEQMGPITPNTNTTEGSPTMIPYTSSSCIECLSYAPTFYGSPAPIDFVLNIRYLDRFTSYTTGLVDNRAFLRVMVKFPLPQHELPFPTTTLQKSIDQPGNIGSIDSSSEYDAESLIETVASWTSAPGQVITFAVETRPTVSNPSEQSTIPFPEATYTELDVLFYPNPTPSISTISELIPITMVQTYSTSCDYTLGLSDPALAPLPIEPLSSPAYTKVQTLPIPNSGTDCLVFSRIDVTRTAPASTTLTLLDTTTKSYYVATSFRYKPGLAPNTMIAHKDSLVCNSLEVPLFFVAPDDTISSSVAQTSWTVFTLTIPLTYTIDLTSDEGYFIRYISSTTTTNTYTITVQPGDVRAIYTILNCPTSDSLDASAQIFSYRVGTNPTIKQIMLTNGYYLRSSLNTLNDGYTIDFPERGVQGKDIEFTLSIATSIPLNYDFVIYTPTIFHQQLFKAGTTIFDQLDQRGLPMTVAVYVDEADSTRILLSLSSPLDIFDSTRWTTATEPVIWKFNLTPYSPYHNDILSQICYQTTCSIPQVYSTKIVPVFNAQWTLRFEVDTDILSEIILNRDMVIQDEITLKWTSAQFDVKPVQIEYPYYTYTVIATPIQQSTTNFDYTATISFSRYWLANEPITFPFNYLPGTTMEPKLQFSLISNGEQIRFHGDDDDNTPSNFILEIESTEFSSTKLPPKPIDNFAFNPEFRSEATIDFQFTIGRPLRFGQQLVFSPLPLLPSQSVTVSFTTEEIVQIPGRYQNPYNSTSGGVFVTVTQHFEFVASTSAAGTYDNCPNCVILTVATTSTLPIPHDGTVIKFSLIAAQWISDLTPHFNTISVSSNGFGIDGLILKDYIVAQRIEPSYYTLYDSVFTTIAPKPADNGLVPICVSNSYCTLLITFNTGTFINTPQAMLATLSFIGYELDVQSMPKGELEIENSASTISLYSFSKNETVYLIKGQNLERMTSFTTTALFTQSNLDGHFSLTFRNLANYSDTSVPDYYHSTTVIGPQVFPDAISTSFFHVNGGAFVGEPVGFGFIPHMPYSSKLSKTTPASFILNFNSLRVGGLYTNPLMDFPVTTPEGALIPNIFSIDPTSLISTRTVGAVQFVQDQTEWTGVFVEAINDYYAANEPLIVYNPISQWKNQFESTGVLASAITPQFDDGNRYVAIEPALIPFIRVRGIRAVRTIPSISVLNLDTPTTFNLTIWEDFLDSVRFMPGDHIILSIPAAYDILSTTTNCIVEGTLTQLAGGDIFATLSPTIGPDSSLHYLSLQVMIPEGPTDVPQDAIPDPRYTCPVTIQVKSSAIASINLSSESPLSTLTFTTISLGTTSQFNFFMPYPIKFPTYSLQFVGFDTVGIPGQLWLEIDQAYFGPQFKISFRIPFSMTTLSSDSGICRSPDFESPLGSILYIAATSTVQFDTFGFLSVSKLICRFSMIPLSSYTHPATETWAAELTTSGSGAQQIGLKVQWFTNDDIDANKIITIDPTIMKPSYAILPPSPQLTLEGDIVTGLTTALTITGEHMSLQPGDQISFSLGVTFKSVTGTTDITGLQCLSNNNEPIATVYFQFVGDSVAGVSPTEKALPDGLKGIANRIQLITLDSTPPSTPWRCTIQLVTMTDHAGRLPDALVQGAAYLLPSIVTVYNNLVFRPSFDIGLGLTRAELPSTSMGSFEFFYNSTSVQLREGGISSSIEISIPLVITSSPVDGLICQLNYGIVKHVPFFVVATSSVATSFLVPTERLIEPTSLSINHVRCLIPDIQAQSNFATTYAKFQFQSTLISAPVSLPLVSKFDISYNVLPFNTQFDDRDTTMVFTPVQLSSSDAIIAEPGRTIILKLHLEHWERVMIFNPILPQGFHLGEACIGNVTEWDRLTRYTPFIFYRSNDTLAWVTLFDEVDTYCFITLDIDETAAVGITKVDAVIGAPPNQYTISFNVNVQQKPYCWPIHTKTFISEDLITVTKKQLPFKRLNSMANVRMGCKGFTGLADLTYQIDFITNSANGLTLNQAAPKFSQMQLLHPTFYGLPVNIGDCVNTTTCTNVFPVNPDMPYLQAALQSMDPTAIFYIDWLVELDKSSTPAPEIKWNGIGGFNTTVPYEIQFTIASPISQSHTFKYFIDVSLIPDTQLPTSPIVAIMPLPTTPPTPPSPRGQAANFLLTMKDIVYNQTWAAPLWMVMGDTDPMNAQITDYFMSPLGIFDYGIGTGLPVACYDPQNVGTSVFAYVSLMYTPPVPALMMPGLIAVAVQPQVDVIEKSLPSSHGLEFACVFPMQVIAPSKITFETLPDIIVRTAYETQSQYPYSFAVPDSVALQIAPTFIRPTFDSLFTNDFNNLQTYFFSSISAEIEKTDSTAYITLSIAGLKVYPGDSLVLQFNPLLPPQNETKDDEIYTSSYRLYAPPVLDQPTPCYNLFYPTSQEVVGYMSALTPNLQRKLGQTSNTFVLDIINGRIGDYQQLVCMAPIVTFSPMTTGGIIYGRLYKPYQFDLLQQTSRLGKYRFQFTTEYRPELLDSTAILYYLPPVGEIKVNIQRNLFLSAHVLKPGVNETAHSFFTVRYTMSSQPTRYNVTLYSDMREYAPSAFISCTNLAQNVRYYGEGLISDTTRNILRFDLEKITESPVIVDCSFYSPNQVPELYWNGGSEIIDGVFTFKPIFYTDAEQVKNRPEFTIPVQLYNTIDLTPGGLVKYDNVTSIADAQLHLQSYYTLPEPALLVTLSFIRPISQPYLDGDERSLFLATLAKNFGKLISQNYNLYTLFKPSDIIMTSQTFSSGSNPGNTLALNSLTSGTLYVTLQFPSLTDKSQLVTPYGEASIATALEPFGVDKRLADNVVAHAFASLVFPECVGGAKCGGNCEPCPVGDVCYNDNQCRSNLVCLTIVENNIDKATASLMTQGTCITEAAYNATKLQVDTHHTVPSASSFKIKTSTFIKDDKKSNTNDTKPQPDTPTTPDNNDGTDSSDEPNTVFNIHSYTTMIGTIIITIVSTLLF